MRMAWSCWCYVFLDCQGDWCDIEITMCLRCNQVLQHCFELNIIMISSISEFYNNKVVRDILPLIDGYRIDSIIRCSFYFYMLFDCYHALDIHKHDACLGMPWFSYWFSFVHPFHAIRVSSILCSLSPCRIGSSPLSYNSNCICSMRTKFYSLLFCSSNEHFYRRILHYWDLIVEGYHKQNLPIDNNWIRWCFITISTTFFVTASANWGVGKRRKYKIIISYCCVFLNWLRVNLLPSIHLWFVGVCV